MIRTHCSPRGTGAPGFSMHPLRNCLLRLKCNFGESGIREVRPGRELEGSEEKCKLPLSQVSPADSEKNCKIQHSKMTRTSNCGVWLKKDTQTWTSTRDQPSALGQKRSRS